MNKRLLVFYLILLMAFPAIAAPPSKAPFGGKATALDTNTWIDVNRILMIVANDGAFATDLGGTLGKTDGLYYPFTSVEDIESGTNTSTVVYASGLWIGAVDVATSDTLICLAEYSEEYGPGPMTAGGSFQPDAFENPAYKVYKLYADSLGEHANADYLNWPADQGAPVDSAGNPAMIGDQMLWTIYNDADPDLHANNSGKTEPLGIEIRQTVFAYDREDPLGEIVFIKFQIFNNGGRDLTNMYVSLWSDPDLGDAGDDLVGCDTVLSVGYCYNGTNNDGTYGSRPPAVGYDFFQGPLTLNTPADTADDGTELFARMWGLDSIPGYHNMGMTRFSKYINGTDPQNKTETYNYMQGLNSDGSALANGTTYYLPGDPTTSTGDLDSDAADRRFMVTTGPFDFGPGDSTEILAAIVVGQGGDRLSSISVMKFNDKFAQLAYDNDFEISQPPASPDVTIREFSNQVTLVWTDASETDPGDYPFEGYTVFQGETPAGPWSRIANYDIDNGQAIIFDEVVDPVSGALEFRAVKFGSDNQIRHYIGITQDVIGGGQLRNNTDYYFKVEAYAFSLGATPQSLTSATVVTATPQAPTVGTSLSNAFGDILETVHVGVSDGSVEPYVVDPTALTGHDYMVEFTTYQPDTILDIYCWQDTTIYYHYDTLTDTCEIFLDTLGIWVAVNCIDTSIDSTIYDPDPDPECDTVTIIPDVTFWTFTDVTTGEVLLDSVLNQSGNEDYRIVDGILLKVMGPDPGVKPLDLYDTDDSTLWGWDIPNGTRRFTWSGANFGFEGFRGAIGWGGPGDTHAGWGGNAPVAPPLLPKVLFKLATVTIDTLEWFVCTAYDADSICIAYDLVDIDTFTALQGIDRDDTLWTYIADSLTDSVHYEPGFDPADENMSYAYRYGRGFTGAPAQPWFAPFMINTVDGGYRFQDFEKSVPLSAWNVDVDPPVRLTVGFLENNQPGGLVNGFWFPGDNSVYDNVDGAGPREWLWIYLNDYSETVNPDYQGEATTDPMPIMYWLTVNRRGNVPFSPDATGEDEFLIVPNYVNTPADAFTFTAVMPQTTATGPENLLDKVKAVPNPYYLFGSYDASVYNRQIRFTNLPEKCTIRIFNLNGDLVDMIEKDGPDNWTTWDVLNSSNIPIASGIYIYVVEAPGFGQKIGKMAIFLEEEQLGTY